MTLWDRALESFPQWQDHLNALGEAFAPGRLDDAAGVLADQLGPSITALAFDDQTPPGGMYGYGLWSQPGGQPRPAVFVQPGLAPFGSAPASITAAGAMLSQLGGLRDGVVAVALPPPQLQRSSSRGQAVGPSMTVTVGSRLATLGLRAHLPESDRAILTAGHAADGPALVRDEIGDLVGRVVRQRDLRSVPPGSITADVAVIEIDGRRIEAQTDTGSYVDAAQPLDEVQIARTASKTLVLGVCPAFALNRRAGSWGHVAITSAAISRDGDSGAPVHRADGAVVGHIVAGYGAAYSLVQDAEYILRDVGALLR